jgi:protein-L-isoaspartate O-methyltransferase
MYIRYHKNAVKKEINCLHLSRSDRVLHIGCGAIPYTSIIIAQEIKAYVVGIDNKSIIVNLAKEFIKKNHLLNIVSIELGDGQNVDVSNFDVIIISYGVVNQDLVLKHVYESLDKNARIILRKSKTDKNKYINLIINKFSTHQIQLLLTQESVLIVKKNQFSHSKLKLNI